MISITGLKEIDNVLKHLSDNVQHRVLSAAHYAAAKPLVEKERQLAPRGVTGNLKESIGAVKVSAARANSVGEVRVGPRRKGGYKGFHGHFPEFGTRSRRTRKGANRGFMPMIKYAKPAFDSTRIQVEGGIAVQLGRAMVRTIRRYAKR
jgi:HK97 gp10 family phage protein